MNIKISLILLAINFNISLTSLYFRYHIHKYKSQSIILKVFHTALLSWVGQYPKCLLYSYLKVQINLKPLTSIQSQAFGKLSSHVDPPIVKVMLNLNPLFQLAPGYSCVRWFPAETNQFCHDILKKSTNGCNISKPIRFLLILKCSQQTRSKWVWVDSLIL